VPDRPEEQEDQQERYESFFKALGLPQNLYVQAIEVSLAFTRIALADANLSPWRSWGARNIGGRIRALGQAPDNPDTLYAGTAHGGVFRTTNGGDTWDPIGTPGDAFPVGALAIPPSRTTTVYVGSGEPIVRYFANAPLAVNQPWPAGLGFWKFDAALGTLTRERKPRFALSGVDPADGAANNYARIAVDPHSPDRCWIASESGLWRRENSAANGFKREPIPVPQPPPGTLGCAISDVILVENWDPQHPGLYRIYAAVSGFEIYRGVFDTTAPAAGTAWTKLTNNLPARSTAAAKTIDRIRLASCRSQPNHIYAAFEDINGDPQVYHSNDGGDSWQLRTMPFAPSNPGLNRFNAFAWYALALEVHPDNPEIVTIGSMNMARSTNSGVRWEQIIDWTNYDQGDHAQHADLHVAMFDVRDHNRLWVANDGGVSVAADVALHNPYTDRSWRKRSHGILGAQFNDITVNPTYPVMLGGGLQDNGIYAGFGGPTWYHISGGDGGQMVFEVQNPRAYIAPFQFVSVQSTVVASGLVPGVGQVDHSPLLADQAGPPNDDFAILNLQTGNGTIPAANSGTFIAVLEKSNLTPGHAIIGRRGDAFSTINLGANWAPLGVGMAAAESVSTIAYSNDPSATADWWVGTDRGRLFRQINAGPVVPFALMALPALGAGALIARVAVHPGNRQYVAVAVAGGATPGRVLLTLDRGANWFDITGTAVVGVPPPPPVDVLRALPPSPITSLAFDPSVPPGNAQMLFAGTVTGVFVIRNLPPANAAALPRPFNPDWRTFNGTAAAPLPLTLVKDLAVATLPRNPGAVPGSLESSPRQRLYAAMFGRGIYACDITAGANGGPRIRLFIRQHVIEDGLYYPRATPTVLNTAPTANASYFQPELQGDPRLPAGVVSFNDISGYDIRIDNEPFQFFDEVLDGVEFDEELRTKSVVPGQLNAIYVQMHTAGWDRADAVDVHLFFAQAPAPAAGVDPNPLPDLQADFWAHFTDEPQLVAPAGPIPAPAAFWQRIGPKKVIPANRLKPTAPVVLRVEWVPPASLGGGFVGLMAVCTSAADPIPVPPVGGPAPPMPTVLRNLIRAERHIAFRLAPVVPYVPDVYIRDTVEDDGQPGAGGAAGRSPDIIVVQAAAADPATEFRDLFDSHAGDRIRTGVDQTIYVRVHNRRSVPVQADVELLWAKPNSATAAPDARAPVFDGSTWLRIAAGVANVNVPANGWAFARFTWQAADVPPADSSEGAFNAIALIALVSSAEGVQDAKPVATRVRDTNSFWQFFNRLSDSNNAAFRAVLYGDPA